MANKARILFVDDEKRVLNSMRGLFRRDYDLFLTCEGSEAIKIAAENEIDVIVADQRMPGMTGVEVLAKIKQNSPRTVRILLTGYADPSAVEGSINMGEVFRFLSKPCPPKLLRETLSLAITASRTMPVAANEPAPAETPTPAVQQHDPELAPATPPVTTAEPVPPVPPVPPTTVVRPQTEPQAPQPAATISDKDETQPALRTLDEITGKSQDEPSDSHWQTVTNVVMSENSVEETQETVALKTPLVGVRDVGVVVFTIDSEFATTAIRAISQDRQAYLATSLGKVAQAITQHNAGVLITDFTSNKTTLRKIIGVLKKHRPELVTIVVSDGRDTTDMINLINYGQVFRYVLKPIEPAELRKEILAAAIRHVNLLNNPESAKRHDVIDPGESGTTSRSINQFIGDVRTRHPERVDPADTIS
jgi:DNA-binding NtrC family response regulator